MKEFKKIALKQKQSLPIEAKIILTQQRIREWYDHFNGDVYVSFSGGKDSTVLKHLVKNTSGVYNVPSVFIDTGLEYPEIKAFVKSFGDVEIIRPKMDFMQVIKKYGYPVISKEVAHRLAIAKPNNANWEILKGTYINKNTGELSIYNSPKYGYLLDAPFKISDRCCDVMKKLPAKEYAKKTGRKPFIATMACESRLRKTWYLETGCNAFNRKNPQSQPMAFWKEQDVLEYIVKNNLKYADVYGEIKQDEKGKYYTTGAKRTGCMFCMFGCHLEKEPNRFQTMKLTHPKLYDYCLNKLGLKQVLDFIGVKY